MSTCGHHNPTDATFCPFCGARNIPAPVNVSGLEAMIAAADVELDEDMPVQRPIIPWVLAAAVTLTASVGVLWTASNIEHAVSEAIEQAQVATTVVEKARPVEVVFDAAKVTTVTTKTYGEVLYDGQTLFRFEGVKGSRYTQMEERTEAIKLRINHAFAAESANEKTPRFAARMVDGTYQIVWQRPDSVFLITDITKDDVRAWERTHGKTSAAIISNLVADRLNILIDANYPPNV